MGKFQSPLRVEKRGEREWVLLEPLIYQSNNVGVIVVDAGFVTNFGSVPRLPFLYMLFGGVGDEAATLHDWLYRKEHTRHSSRAVYSSAVLNDWKHNNRPVKRETADKVLRGVIIECLTRSGLSVWRAKLTAWAMWAGVRIGGASHWE